jgi:uncharacterized protein with von Willebrand factor type A (vWA) domain
LENQITIIKPENILHALAATASNQPDTSPTFSQLFRKAYNTDPFPNQVLEMLRNGTKQCKDITLAECEEYNNLLLY